MGKWWAGSKTAEMEGGKANPFKRVSILFYYPSDPGKRNDSGKLVNSNRTQSQSFLFSTFHKAQVTWKPDFCSLCSLIFDLQVSAFSFLPFKA